jgi:hypothetical protein
MTPRVSRHSDAPNALDTTRDAYKQLGSGGGDEVRLLNNEYATRAVHQATPPQAVKCLGLDQPRGCPLTSQAIGVLLRNQLYAGIVDVTEYGVRGKRGDFEPLISEELFFRVQGVLSGHLPSTTPKQRAHPDFPLRAFVRCESCGRGLTRSWPRRRPRTQHPKCRLAKARPEPDLR